MRVVLRTVVAAYAVVLVLGASAAAVAGGRGDRPAAAKEFRSEYDYVDLGLTPAQEETLARELHASGKLWWKAERTPEEENALRYLTRPVPMCDEVAPGGLSWNLMVSFKEGTTEAEMAALLADLGNPPIVREKRREDGSPDYVYLRLPRNDFSNDHLPEDLAETLRKEAIQVPGEYDSLLILRYNSTYLDPRHPCISTVWADPYLSCDRVDVRKRLLTVTYLGSVTEDDILAFLNRHGLVEIRRHGGPHKHTASTVFTSCDAPLGQVQNELWNDPTTTEISPLILSESFLRGTLPRDLPTDPYWEHQWNLHQNRSETGTSYTTGDDSRDYDIDGPEGWWVYNHSGASGTPVIAVIDVVSGVGPS